MTKSKPTQRFEREARLRWVPLGNIKVNPLAQRELNPARVDKLVCELDLEQIGNPTVNHRGDYYYCIDGQHRIEALKKWLGDGWDTQQLQCWCYDELPEDVEAERFLKLNDTLTVSSFAKFRVGVTSGRAEECDIDRIVRAQNLRVSQEQSDGAIAAVGTLRKVYRRGPTTLARTLRIVRDSYGDAGMLAPVLDGVGLLCQRYDGELDEESTVKKLGNLHAGVNGLLGKAEVIRKQTGNQKAHCVAAAAVEVINSSRGGKRLPSWWRTPE